MTVAGANGDFLHAFHRSFVRPMRPFVTDARDTWRRRLRIPTPTRVALQSPPERSQFLTTEVAGEPSWRTRATAQPPPNNRIAESSVAHHSAGRYCDVHARYDDETELVPVLPRLGTFPLAH